MPLRDVSNPKYREMVHYCSPCSRVLVSLGDPRGLFHLSTKTSSPFAITVSHATIGRKKRDLRSLDYHASRIRKLH